MEAASPALGEEMYRRFLTICEELGHKPECGVFGADMKVASVNDGPVTILLDTKDLMETHRRN